MKIQLTTGIPSETDYKLLIESDTFRNMEIFSGQFLAENRALLGQYAKKWVADPLHQWSRQWEYPFVFSCLKEGLANTVKPRILDAGSGMTFFPYYVKKEFIYSDMHCCDIDESLKALYEAINGGAQNGVEFSKADMRNTPYADNWFDAVYCVSVLEHTINYEEIICDFHRLLRPGGKLIITFDISLDGTRDISPEQAVKLLDSLNKKFVGDFESSAGLMCDISNKDIFTTMSAKKIDANLLPWKYPAILHYVKAVMGGKRIGHWPPLLSVYCLCLTKSHG